MFPLHIYVSLNGLRLPVIFLHPAYYFKLVGDRGIRYTLLLNLYLLSLNWRRDVVPCSIASSWNTEHTWFEKILIERAILEYSASSHFSLDNLRIFFVLI